MSSRALAELEPRLVWDHFLALTRIPRPPKEEEEARRHVRAWAGERGLPAEVDREGNVLVRVAASAEREQAPVAVLQSHLDMVCERDPDSANDPREGRIEVVRDGDWVAAAGTTLGADNGIGVAAAMAVAEDPELAHGPLELLFTVSEEQGLEGAKALDPALVSGRILLNLDGSSDEGLTIGCAGSSHTFARVALGREAVSATDVALAVRVAGARGGHSGGDIARGRVNAIKALGRVLSRGYAVAPFGLARLDGGVSRNAIPRDAEAVIVLPEGSERAFREAAQSELSAIRAQYAASDGEVLLEVDGGRQVELGAGPKTAGRALDLLAALPTGVLAVNPDLPGIVETSTSLNVVETESETVTFASMTRSSNAQALEDVVAAIEAAARLAGAHVEVLRSYPPWVPDLGSSLLASARATYERLYDAEPKLDVVHGGLECAVIGAKLPGVEMISVGPRVEGPHAPGERLSVSSTERFYGFLGALLDDLSR